ncbi:hypothetical protein LIER_11709 [Lithospermum erythrorhizon]|uniref:Retrotransposon Copia-like N-terminal domain-containing protein n=1 Tax=Lithospermum erythrorhizon TaxID=34254 RepID=A0AAV3PP12_LITER
MAGDAPVTTPQGLNTSGVVDAAPLAPLNPPKIDHNSPFYLSSNDNPRNLISTVIFNGNNYDAWSKSLSLSLIARRKFGFIDGTVAKPTTGTLVADWQCVQAMLVQWILNTIDSSLRKTIPYFEEAHPLWIVLQRRFDVGSETCKQHLKAALAECKQLPGITIGDYFGKLQPLWDELVTYDPIPSCLCGFCLCDLGEKFQWKQDNDRLHEFLCRIHVDRFGALRSSLLSQDPPFTLDRAYHAMLQEEQLQSKWGFSIDRDEVMAMAAQAPSHGKVDLRTKGNNFCTFCHRSGHGISTCFAKNGYPEWWGDRPRGSGRGGGLKASGPHRPGAQRGPAQPGRALEAYSPSLSTSSYNAGGSLSDVEWQKLKIMLRASDVGAEDRLTGKSLPSNWIIDTGTSSHVTGPHLGTLTGLGERRNGLYYYFCSILENWVLHVDGKMSSALWHRGLRHPSDKVVRSLSFISNSSHLSNKACIVCHQAKQSRDSFVNSDYKATRSFELIHCDLWGP